jgi:para-nitrobenzyl esterase
VKNEKNVITTTTLGKVKGVCRGEICEFKGIPYAAPPTGARRWMPPFPHESWSGVRDALAFGAVAPQIVRAGGPVQFPGFGTPEPQSEDCLFLNIWTPGLDDALRPVMVWIHGGGFNMGSSSQPTYWGDVLASRGDVVLVSINYRLGLLGFLNLNEVTGGEIPATGNEGLLDQIAALKWVRDNIRTFGGDPSNVTIFGESAGGMSVGCLLAMPEAKGLFHKAIMESGTGAMARPLDTCVDVSREFLKMSGLKNDDVAGLRALASEKILSILQDLTLAVPGRATPVAPVIDGIVIPGRPLEIAQSGRGLKVPIMVGNNLEEMKIMHVRLPDILKLDETGLVRMLKSTVPSEYMSLLLETYKNARAKRGDSTAPAEILSAVRTDISQRIPAVQLAEAYSKYKQPAYNFIFTWKSPVLGGILGACHTLELGFVFGKYQGSNIYGSGPELEGLSRKMQDAWIAFARKGNPSCDSLGPWPVYYPGRQVMMLGPDCEVKEEPYEEERQLWETIGEVPMGI